MRVPLFRGSPLCLVQDACEGDSIFLFIDFKASRASKRKTDNSDEEEFLARGMHEYLLTFTPLPSVGANLYCYTMCF